MMPTLMRRFELVELIVSKIIDVLLMQLISIESDTIRQILAVLET